MHEINKDYAVQMRGITKYFGSCRALDGVDLDIKKGEIHAILGENGAGKSTLMNILYGMYGADGGNIYLNGKEVFIRKPSAAIAQGIGMVHQHFMLVEKFTVLQNIVLGNETTNFFGVLNMRKAKKKLVEIIEKYGLKVDLKKKVKKLSVGMQQKVEILKALYRGADILILDEPTAVLTPMEVDELLETMNNLKKAGKTIIIITHKLKEIKKSAEVCTIIRKGQFIDRVNVADESEQSLAEKMVGRKVKLMVDKDDNTPGDTIFEIKDLSVRCERGIERVKNLSMKIRRGEIYGLAGIEGNGQTELLQCILGRRYADSGKILMNGKEIQNTSTRNVLDSKISFIHADRHKYGCILDMSVADNAIMEKYREEPFSKNGFLNYDKRDSFTEGIINKYDVRPTNCKYQKIRNLSGGNQQKLVFGREIANNPDLLIAVQPTRGLDVGAIEYVHSTLVELRDQGKAVLLISLELDEILNLSDRIAVIYGGEIVGEFNQKEADEHRVGLLMAGGKEND